MTTNGAFIGFQGRLSASRDLSREWRSCCLRAGGWDEELLDSPRIESSSRDDDNNDDEKRAAINVINLVANVDDDDDNRDDVIMDDDMAVKDGWLAAVREIEKNLNRMIEWLQEKKWTFSSVDTPDAEASLIQSTIASYTASTANELEELRSVLLAKQQVNYRSRPQEFEHHNIIVQTLLQRLKEEVAEPFGKMQKQRQREAVKLWQNPLRVELYLPPPVEEDEMDAALGIAATSPRRDESNQKFMPQQRRLPLQSNFMESYEANKTRRGPLEKPVSLFAKGTKRASISPVAAGGGGPGAAVASSSPPRGPVEKRSKVFQNNSALTKPSYNPQVVPEYQATNENDLHYAQPQDLQQEAVLMKASLENDLDQVQKMETTMVSITNLLSQFADLVAGQQEDILHIHDAAETTKENVDKGQEKLLDAADKTQQSKHYMASAITAMGVMLLFVHWIRP